MTKAGLCGSTPDLSLTRARLTAVHVVLCNICLVVIKIRKGLTYAKAIGNLHSSSRGSDDFCARDFLCRRAAKSCARRNTQGHIHPEFSGPARNWAAVSHRSG